MTIFGEIDLGIDKETGLQKKVLIWKIDIDGKTEIITVKYDISLISPTGIVVKIIATNIYRRFNRPAVMSEDGETIITPANMKWDQLKDSAIGQGILSMIDLDVKNYPNLAQN